MDYVFVAGEGDLGLLKGQEDSKLGIFEDQSAEFLSVAVNLCNQFALVPEFSGTVTLYKTPRHKNPTELKNGVNVHDYSDARQLVTFLAQRGQRFVLGICGHGGQAVNLSASEGLLGYVELCQGLTSNARQISSTDINSFATLVVYFGLHCHAGSLTNRLSSEIFCFPVIGEEKAQNTHMDAFTKQSSSQSVPSKLDFALCSAECEDVDWRDASGAIFDALSDLNNATLTQPVKKPTGIKTRPGRWQ